MMLVVRLSVVLTLVLSTSLLFGEEVALFNGKDLQGWTFHRRESEPPRKANEVWVVRDRMLVCTGAASGYLMHEKSFADYVLTLEWRSMKVTNGVSVGGLGSLLLRASEEEGSFGYPKSVEVVLDRPGNVYFRDIASRTDAKDWAFRAPSFADDVESEMGDWNRVKVICHARKLTVFLNGTAINQVAGMKTPKGRIGITSQRGFFPAPTFYRNIRVVPFQDSHLQEERRAAQQLAKRNAASAAKVAAQEARRAEEARKEKQREEKFAESWTKVEVQEVIEFKPDVRYLPFPSDAREVELDATFGDIEMMSSQSIQALSAYFRTEMAKRGFEELEKERDEDSIEVTFRHGTAKVELQLQDKARKGVKIEMDCDGISFALASDPQALAAIGIAQPRAYLFLQKEIELPSQVQGLAYEGGDRCRFKSTLKLQEAFDVLGRQLRAKGYRETRRPIVSGNRRYTEFARGGIEVSVNVFSDRVGSRVILTYDE